MDHTFEKKPELDKVKEGEEISEHEIRKEKKENVTAAHLCPPSFPPLKKSQSPIFQWALLSVSWCTVLSFENTLTQSFSIQVELKAHLIWINF